MPHSKIAASCRLTM